MWVEVRRAGRIASCVGVAALAVGGCGAQASKSKAGPAGVVVLDAQSSRERWHLSLPGSNQSYSAAVGTGIVLAIKEPCGGDGSQEQLDRGEIGSFDAATGERRWTTPGRSAVATKTMTWQDSSTVDAAASGVIVATGGRLGSPIPGLDAKTGKLRWKISESFLGVSDSLVFATSAKVDVGGSLDAFDRRSGSRRWTFPTAADASWGGTFDVVAADRSTVVVANGAYLTHAGSSQSPTTMFVLDAGSGRERSRFVVAEPAIPFSDFGIHDGLLVYADGGNAVGRDLEDGAVRWTHPSPQASAISEGGVPRSTIRVSADGASVFVGGARGFSDVLDASTGSLRWTAEPVRFFEAATRGEVIVADTDQGIAALDAMTGRQQWKRSTLRIFDQKPGFEVGVAASGSTVAVSPTCGDG
jgi:outer membrane protein assembly factor BamB